MSGGPDSSHANAIASPPAKDSTSAQAPRCQLGAAATTSKPPARPSAPAPIQRIFLAFGRLRDRNAPETIKPLNAATGSRNLEGKPSKNLDASNHNKEPANKRRVGECVQIHHLKLQTPFRRHQSARYGPCNVRNDVDRAWVAKWRKELKGFNKCRKEKGVLGYFRNTPPGQSDTQRNKEDDVAENIRCVYIK